MLGHIQSESNHWRLRKLLASQLKDCVELFEPKVVYKIHVPIALKLCRDDVAEVRNQACVNIPPILKTLRKEKSKDYFEKVVKEIFKFADSNRYVQRQIFVIMCADILAEDMSMFCKHFMPKFIEKQNDRVVNVRIVLAKYCGKFLSNFVESDYPYEPERTESTEEEKIEPTESNIQKNKLQYERLLNEKKFMKMVVRLKNDDKPDVTNQITNQVNFDKLLSFIKQNKHRVEDLKLFDEDDDEQTAVDHQEEPDEENVEFDFSEENPSASVGIWSLYSARSIIEEVISNSTDDDDEFDD